MVAGTQSDKLFEVIDTMRAILRKMPQYEGKFNSSKDALLKRLETERVLGLDLLNFEKKMKRMGTTRDWRPAEFKTVQKMTLPELSDFYRKNLAPLKYDILIVGKTSQIDRKRLARYGEIVDLKLEDIFGY